MTLLLQPATRQKASISVLTLDVLARELRPIDLATILEESSLQTRLDRKYLVPKSMLQRMLDDLAPDLSVLEISDSRVFAYRSVYFDTVDLELFRHHAQGRRRRIKVRTRTYVESSTCFMEVKSKGSRGITVKDRIPYAMSNSDCLTREAQEFVARVAGSHEIASNLLVSLESNYRRMTLVDNLTHDRVTCDEDLRFVAGGLDARGLPDEVLVETKTAGRAGSVDRWLLAHGIRSHSVSKYCVGIGLLYPHVSANQWHRTLRRHFDWERSGLTKLMGKDGG